MYSGVIACSKQFSRTNPALSRRLVYRKKRKREKEKEVELSDEEQLKEYRQKARESNYRLKGKKGRVIKQRGPRILVSPSYAIGFSQKPTQPLQPNYQSPFPTTTPTTLSPSFTNQIPAVFENYSPIFIFDGRLRHRKVAMDDFTGNQYMMIFFKNFDRQKNQPDKPLWSPRYQRFLFLSQQQFCGKSKPPKE